MVIQNIDYTEEKFRSSEVRKTTNKNIEGTFFYNVPEKISWTYGWIISPIPVYKEIGMGYIAVFESDDEGGFTVTIPTLPGCITEGESLEEAYHYLQDALEGWIKVALDKGLEIPEPDGTFMQ
jgi:predicted RNase H-like HicB family nuclease